MIIRRRTRRRSPVVRFGVVAAGLAVIVFGIAAVLTVLRLGEVADDLRTANAILEEASAAVEDGRVADGEVLLNQAAVLVTGANTDLYGRPEFDLISWIPVVDRNLSSLRSSMGTALTLVNGGRSILVAGRPLVGSDGRLDVPLSSGTIPLDAVRDVGRELDRVASSVGTGGEVDDSMLFGEVKELRERVSAEAVRRQKQFGVLGRALQVVVDLSGGSGPRRYLIAVANTAEMRGSGGMILNYGVLLGQDGDFELGEFGRVEELALDQPVSVEASGLPDDYLRRWDGFDPLLRWQNASLSADFTLTAPVLAAMYEQSTGARVDGVIQIDPDGLAAILEGTGPVDVPDLGLVTANNVVDLTLNQAYIRFPDIDERSDVLTAVAEAAFKRLVEGQYESLRPLADALVRSSQARHVLAWSRGARIESVFSSFDVDGSLPAPDASAFALTVQNLSGNKLDYYVDTAIAITGGSPDGDVTATVRVTNTVSSEMDEPKYIVGPFDRSQEVGRYRGSVSLYVPVGTQLMSSDRLGTVIGPPTVQSEAGRTVVGFTIEVDPESATSVDLRLRLPPGTDVASGIRFVSSPRVRPTTASVDVNLGGSSVRGTATLDRYVEIAGGER